MERLKQEIGAKHWVFWLLMTGVFTLDALLIAMQVHWLVWAIPVFVLTAFAFIFSMDLVLWFLVFATPLAINLENLFPGLSLSVPTEPLLAALLAVFWVKVLLLQLPDRRIFGHPVVIMVIIQLVWMLVTSATSHLPVVSFKYLVARMWFVVPLLGIATPLFKDMKKIRLFFWLYIVSLTVVIINTTYNHAGFGFSEKGANWAMAPFYNDHTAYAVVIALFIPVLAGFVLDKTYAVKKRVLIFSVLCLFVVALVLSYCRAAWFSLAVAFGVMLLIVLKIKLRWLLLGLVVLAGCYLIFQQQIVDRLEKNKQDSSANYSQHIESMLNVSTDASNLERINRWNCALRMFKEHPNLGWGPGTYQFVYAPFQLSREKTIISTNEGIRGNAHSEYLGPLSESGWPGLLNVLLVFGFIVFTAIRVFQQAPVREVRLISLITLLGLVSYFAHGMMNNFLDTDKAAVPFWGFVAVIVALDLYHKK